MKAMFSVGDYKLDNTSQFAKVIGKDYVQGMINKTKGIPGTRRAHIRTVKGKAQMVGQSILKAGKSTAGKLSAGGAAVVGAGKKYGSQGLAMGKKYGGQALGQGQKYATGAVNVVKANPKASAIAAGAGVLGVGTGYLTTRKKRKRR